MYNINDMCIDKMNDMIKINKFEESRVWKDLLEFVIVWDGLASGDKELDRFVGPDAEPIYSCQYGRARTRRWR